MKPTNQPIALVCLGGAQLANHLCAQSHQRPIERASKTCRLSRFSRRCSRGRTAGHPRRPHTDPDVRNYRIRLLSYIFARVNHRGQALQLTKSQGSGLTIDMSIVRPDPNFLLVYSWLCIQSHFGHSSPYGSCGVALGLGCLTPTTRARETKCSASSPAAPCRAVVVVFVKHSARGPKQMQLTLQVTSIILVR